MELTIRERLGIIMLLPSGGDGHDVLITDDIDEKVNLFAEEQKEVGFFLDAQGMPAWQTDKIKDIKLTKEEIQYIKDRIRILHEKKQIPQFSAKAVRKFGLPEPAKDPQ